jgi:hypothetical protein
MQMSTKNKIANNQIQMIGYIITIIIISIIVSIITEQMLIRRLRLEEGVIISKGKCMLKPGYGMIPPVANNLSAHVPSVNNELMGFYRPLK